MKEIQERVMVLKADKALVRKYKVDLYWGFYAWNIAMAGLLSIIILSATLFKKTQIEWIVNAATLLLWPLLAWAMISVFKAKTTVIKEKIFYLRAFKDMGGMDAMPEIFKNIYPEIKAQKKILFLQWNKIIEDEILKKALVVVLFSKMAMYFNWITLTIVTAIGIAALIFFGARLWKRHTRTSYVNIDVFVIYTLSQLLTPEHKEQ